jgi:hypothetical protein
MNKINTRDTIRKSDPDFYFEHIYENEDKNFDMAKTKYTLKPEEVVKLKKSHDYLENARLKAWNEKFQESKRKRSTESFEYLL